MEEDSYRISLTEAFASEPVARDFDDDAPRRIQDANKLVLPASGTPTNGSTW
ncbi:hypothetical protein ACFYZU_33790 [Streptomyces sp. NPDC001651]|uniref:hypothetical protein n=1 Tax=Streptomyces sp. NPDC001651 TaxID=3364596 RepID=UPI0036CFCF97